MKSFRTMLVLSVGLLLSLSSVAQINVAAAADLTFAMNDIAAQYHKQTGSEVKLSFGSSGNFVAQIQSGAPFDVFLSADVDYPQKLVAAGRALPDSLLIYARGRLVMWAPTNSLIDVDRGLKALLDPRVKKIAIANPQHAPYGRAAVAALRSAGIYQQIESKLVFGENISQTAQFVSSGNADVGLIALSLAVAPGQQGKGKYWKLPADAAPPIEQAAVAIKGERAVDAKQFIAFLTSPIAIAILERYGFTVPKQTSRTEADRPR